MIPATSSSATSRSRPAISGSAARCRAARRFPKGLPAYLTAALILLFLLPGCRSAPPGATPTPPETAPNPATDRRAPRAGHMETNAPAYLADSFRYDEAGLFGNASGDNGPPTPRRPWCDALDASMAPMRYDYVTGLCLYWTGSEAHFKRGFLMDILGYHDLAIIEYTLAIDIDPENDRYYNNRGSLYLLEDRPYRAVLDFTRAIAVNPNRPEAYYNRGRALEKMGKYDEARRDYDRAVELGICDTYPSLKICR